MIFTERDPIFSSIKVLYSYKSGMNVMGATLPFTDIRKWVILKERSTHPGVCVCVCSKRDSEFLDVVGNSRNGYEISAKLTLQFVFLEKLEEVGIDDRKLRQNFLKNSFTVLEVGEERKNVLPHVIQGVFPAG